MFLQFEYFGCIYQQISLHLHLNFKGNIYFFFINVKYVYLQIPEKNVQTGLTIANQKESCFNLFPYQGTQSGISEVHLGLVTDNKQVSLTSLRNKHFLAHTSNDEFLFLRMMYIEKKRGQVHNFVSQPNSEIYKCSFLYSWFYSNNNLKFELKVVFFSFSFFNQSCKNETTNNAQSHVTNLTLPMTSRSGMKSLTDNISEKKKFEGRLYFI